MVKTKVPEHKFKAKKGGFFKKTTAKKGDSSSNNSFKANNSAFLKKSTEKQKGDTSSNQRLKKGVFFRKDTQQESSSFLVKSSSEKTNDETSEKKPFDKNKWRENKYSLKSKVDKWKNKRVEYIRHEYKKQVNKSKSGNFDVQKIYEEEEKRQQEEIPESHDETTEPDTSNRKTRKQWKKDMTVEDKEQAKEEFLRRKAEKEMAIEKYRKNKIEKHKKLNMKTKRGQPIMKGRMELLLEKIQESMNS